jgi:hypothetical protein
MTYVTRTFTKVFREVVDESVFVEVKEEDMSGNNERQLPIESGLTDEQLAAIERIAMKVDYSPCFQGLVRCCATMRSVYQEQAAVLPKVEVLPEDYVEAERIFKRIVRDSIFIFNDVMMQGVGMGGILRLT